MSKTRVLLADDHALVRAGFRALLERLTNVEVAGEASDGREALTLVADLKPDIVLMDVSMVGLNGLEAAARIAEDFPQTKVIMLSMHDKPEFVAQALRAGASGYLLKECTRKELEMALQAVLKGERWLTARISRTAVDRLLARTDESTNPLDQLTRRQREILQLIAEGKNTKEIGSILNISAKTVETHRMHLMNRLGIHDVAGLVHYAIRCGLVPPPA